MLLVVVKKSQVSRMTCRFLTRMTVWMGCHLLRQRAQGVSTFGIGMLNSALHVVSLRCLWDTHPARELPPYHQLYR